MRRFLLAVLLTTGCTSGGIILDDDDDAVSDDDDAVSDDDDAVDAPDFSVPGSTGAGNTTLATLNRGGKNLFIDVWYPSDADGDRREYGSDGFEVGGESIVDGAGACEEPRPVMVHSHGNTSIRWEMFFLHEHMATHGWLIAAPDHAGNTFYDESANFLDLYAQRPWDVADTFDALLLESSRPGSPISGCVDASAGYVVAGYSFGGYTAFATAGARVNDQSGTPTYDFSDPRATGVVTYFPWTGEALGAGIAEVDVPVMTLGGARDATVGTDYEDLMGPVRSTPRALGVWPDGGHFTLAQIYCPFVDGDGCGDDFVDPDSAEDAAKVSVLAFLTGNLDLLEDDGDTLTWEIDTD